MRSTPRTEYSNSVIQTEAFDNHSVCQTQQPHIHYFQQQQNKSSNIPRHREGIRSHVI